MALKVSPTHRMLRRKQGAHVVWRQFTRCVPVVVLLASVYALLVFQTTTLESIRNTSIRSAHPAPASKSKQQQHVACRYHGNCPLNSVCDGGICVSFLQEESDKSSDTTKEQLEKCVQACLPELRMDERFYRGMTPQIQRSYLFDNLGCIIQYRQQRRSESDPPVGTTEEWMDARFRRLVRVDVDPSSPAFTKNPNDKNPPTDQLLWNAFCRPPCQSDSDCPGDDMVCVGRPQQRIALPVPIQEDPKSCQRKATAMTQQKQDMVIVTGADEAYYSPLRNFAASLKHWAPHRKLVVYNLGMTDLQLKDIPKWTNVMDLKWKSGIPQSLPDHVHSLKNYAWKSIIINETVHEYKSIFWLDAGCTFTSPIDAIEEIIHHNGVFLVRGQDEDMKKLSHEGTYGALGYNKHKFRTQGKGHTKLMSPHYAGGVQGHVYPSRFVDSIVVPNAQCAMDANCIAPKGSFLGNHRFDQTSLSILAYQSTVQAPSYTEYVAGGREQLAEDLRQPSERIFWTSRGANYFFPKKVKLRDY